MLASLTSLTGLNVGPLRDNPASRQLLWDAISEVVAVGGAAGTTLSKDMLQGNWKILMGMPDDVHASMLDDLRREKPLELEYLSGDVVRIGKRYGVETPIHSVLYAALKPIADGLEDAH